MNSDERDYDEEAASQPLMVGEHEDEGPSGDHLPDCEMFTGHDGPAGCNCGGFPCESGFSIGPAHDPYGVNCEYIQRDHPARGGRRIHRGVKPAAWPRPGATVRGVGRRRLLRRRSAARAGRRVSRGRRRARYRSLRGVLVAGQAAAAVRPGGLQPVHQAVRRLPRASGRMGNRFIVNPDAAGGQHDPRVQEARVASVRKGAEAMGPAGQPAGREGDHDL